MVFTDCNVCDAVIGHYSEYYYIDNKKVCKKCYKDFNEKVRSSGIMSDGVRDAFRESQQEYFKGAHGAASRPMTKEESEKHGKAVDSFFKTEQPTQGVKFDSNKIPVELLPTQALEEIAKVLAFGAKKYASWNWAKGMNWSRLIGACIRHLYAYARGEDKDPESGLSHIAHAGCCVLFLLQYDISKLGTDDRYKEFTTKSGNTNDSK